MKKLGGYRMKKLVGAKWGSLDGKTQDMLLFNVKCVDGITGNEVSEDGEWILDLVDNLSVCGKVVDGEVVIDDDAVIYDPCE